MKIEMGLERALMRLNAVGYEYVQSVRVKSMNQVRDLLRKIDMGIPFDAVEDKKEKEKYETKYNDSKLPDLIEELGKEGKFEHKEEYTQYLKDIFEIQIPIIQDLEKFYKKRMTKLVTLEPIYNDFLDKIRGIDKILSAKLIKEIGYCKIPNTVSQLWAYAGLSVVNGVAIKRKKGESKSYNYKLKPLIWLITRGFLIHNKGYYRQIYDTEKEKQLNTEYPEGYLADRYNGYKKEDTKLLLGHAHNRALRKMGKIFLDHYWHCARGIIGLPAKKNYVEGVLLHDNIVTWREALEMEGMLKKDKEESDI